MAPARSSSAGRQDFAYRDDIVIATKRRHPRRPGPNAPGLSRKAIMAEADDSLRRLGMDYIDLYQIHRKDYGTPIEETLEALHDLVKAGKVRYLGASSMCAWEFAKACTCSASTAGQNSSPCRTTTTCSTGKRNGRCSRCVTTRASA